MTVKSAKITVYPKAWVDGILGGRHAGPLNRAIECWASVLGIAVLENQERFNAQDWEFLGATLDHRPDPRDPDPGPRLAQSLEASQLEGPTPEVLRVTRRLLVMHYTAIWAILECVAWHKKHPEVKEWWTLAARQQNSS
jgi:hypothetical protein